MSADNEHAVKLLQQRATPKHILFATFYRAMHFSAKRAIAIACRLSVRL